MGSSSTYPFRFYGARPGDWFEAACGGHLWEAQFKAPLDAPARARVAQALQQGLVFRTSIARSQRSTRFSGRWMLLALGEAGEDSDLFWDDVAGLWGAVHDAVPIEEIHYAGTTEDSYPDEWSQWSREQKEDPGPAPAWPDLDLNLDFYGAGIERLEVAIEEDDAFDRLARAPAAKAAVATTTLLRLVPTPTAQRPERPRYSMAAVERSRATSWARPIGHDGRFFALQMKGKRYAPALVDSAGIRLLAGVGTAPTWSYDVSPDGQTLFLGREGASFLVALADGTLRPGPKPEVKPGSMAVAGDLFVLQQTLPTGDVLDLWRAGPRWKRLVRVPSDAYSFLQSIPGQPVIVATSKGAADPTLFLLVTAEGFQVLGRWAQPVKELHARDGRICLLAGAGDTFERALETTGDGSAELVSAGTYVTLLGLEEAIAAARSAPHLVADLRAAALPLGVTIDADLVAPLAVAAEDP
jgi:hypothetical protein